MPNYLGDYTIPMLTQPIGATTAPMSSVPASTDSVQLLSANQFRKGFIIYNDSSSNSIWLAFGPTASQTNFTVKIPAKGYYESPIPSYIGIVSGIWDGSTGAARITEMV